VDPLTHALLGASVSRVALARPLGRAAWLPGAVGALLPDADALIRSASDPLMYAEFHRHFTHSLAFVPLGGLIAALPWLLRGQPPGRRLAYYGAATAGYATHGFLDAATTYGTLLFWPFSGARVGFSWISIVDPLFTVVLLIGVALALWRRSAAPVAAALVLCALYLGSGSMQRERALAAQERIAAERGHLLVRSEAFPTFGNQIIWRSLYEAADSLHFDRVRVPWLGRGGWVPGTAEPMLRHGDLPEEVRSHPRLRRDLRRFSWFASDWLALDPADPTVIGDARYSSTAAAFSPVWGIRLDGSVPGGSTEWIDRSRSRDLEAPSLFAEVLGRSPALQPLP
jgi:inner membrane protein